MKSVFHLSLAVLMLSLVGCATTQEDYRAERGPGEPIGETEEPRLDEEDTLAYMCPMLLSGTRVQMEETESGAILTFTTYQRNVADLQNRVQYMAGVINETEAGETEGPSARQPDDYPYEEPFEPGLQPGPTEDEQDRPGQIVGDEDRFMRQTLLGSKATMSRTQDGARLILEADSPDEVYDLQQAARLHTRELSQGYCPTLVPQPTPAR